MLYIQENFVNLTEGHRFYESPWYETSFETTSDLFKDLRRAYGRATRMYIDRTDGSTQQVGWVFTKSVLYSDARRPSERYQQEVWVSVSTHKPNPNANSPWKERKERKV